MSRNRTTTRRTLGVAATSALALAFACVLVPGSAATAADATNAGGWLRLGHLSPDTKAVDVEVVPSGGDTPVLELENVAYGDVSPYSQLSAGRYIVSMVPAGAVESTAPVISSRVTIGDSGASTVVAYGPSADLEVKAIADDLTPPSAGMARIRLMQASTLTDTVDVKTTTGLTIADDAVAGSVTDYAEVPAGTWTLELTGADVDGSTDVDVAAGSVVTLFVLDTADGDLTIRPIVDSAAVGLEPVGGVATGGGGTAPQSSVAQRSAGKMVAV